MDKISSMQPKAKWTKTKSRRSNMKFKITFFSKMLLKKKFENSQPIPKGLFDKLFYFGKLKNFGESLG